MKRRKSSDTKTLFARLKRHLLVKIPDLPWRMSWTMPDCNFGMLKLRLIYKAVLIIIILWKQSSALYSQRKSHIHSLVNEHCSAVCHSQSVDRHYNDAVSLNGDAFQFNNLMEFQLLFEFIHQRGTYTLIIFADNKQNSFWNGKKFNQTHFSIIIRYYLSYVRKYHYKVCFQIDIKISFAFLSVCTVAFINKCAK